MCSLLYFSFLHTVLDPFIVLGFFPPMNFHHPFCKSQSKSCPALTGSINTNESCNTKLHHCVCSGHSPLCFQPAQAGTWAGLYCGSSWFWFYTEEGQKMPSALKGWGYSCEGWSWSSDPQPQHRMVSPPAQTWVLFLYQVTKGIWW